MSDEINRRQFLRTSGLGLGGLAIAGCVSRTQMPETAGTVATRAGGGDPSPATPGAGMMGSRVAHIGVQLYTVRDLMKRDMAGTLKAIAAIGYREVEFAGYFDQDPKAVRAMLDADGLSAPSAHVPIEMLRSNMAGVLAASRTVGHELVICPYAKLATIDEWRALADELNRFGAACQQAGLRFGYHNHDHELTAIGGTLPYDVLLENTDPRLVRFEMDLFWTVKAGKDPLAYFDRWPGRFPAVHVKDMKGIAGPQAMVAVGEGDIDFRRIFAQAEKAGIEHYIVEHDNPADALASVRTSYGNLRTMLA